LLKLWEIGKIGRAAAAGTCQRVCSLNCDLGVTIALKTLLHLFGTLEGDTV